MFMSEEEKMLAGEIYDANQGILQTMQQEIKDQNMQNQLKSEAMFGQVEMFVLCKE